MDDQKNGDKPAMSKEQFEAMSEMLDMALRFRQSLNQRSDLRKMVPGDKFQRFEELVANVVTSRSALFQQLFDPRRDIDDECGYPRSETGWGVGSIQPEMLRSLYERECIATRVVQVLPRESWQGSPTVYEDPSPDTVTEFEEAWDSLSQTLRGKSWYQDEKGSPVWEHLQRADVLSGIGHFGLLLLGIDDGKNLDQPVDGVVTYSLNRLSNQLTANMRAGRGKKRLSYPTRPSKEVDEGPNLVKDPKTGLITRNGVRKFDTEHGDEPVGGYPRPTPVDNYVTDASVGLIPSAQGSDRTYDQFPLSGAMGTDAQYVGVQLSPPEFPSEEPSKQRQNLLFLRAFDESLVQIVQYEADVRNPRFGMPVMYRITLNDPREMHSGIGLPMATVRVHWSRVLHLADNLGSSEIFGVPRMRPVLNRLLDLRKLYGGSAEMYWRGAFPGISLETHPQLGGDVEVNQQQVLDMMEQYMNGLQRYLSLMGMSAKTLSPQVVDPTPQITVQIEAICIQIACPVRVFKGSERGELASTQDDETWNDRKRERQDNYITPRIIVPFVDRLILMGVLPEPEGYSVEWPDLDSLSEKDKAGIALQKTQALGAFVTGQVESIMSPKAYLTEILGMNEEKAEAILDEASQAHDDSETMTMPPQIEGRPAEPAEGTEAAQQQQQQQDQFEAMQDTKAAQGQGGASQKEGNSSKPTTNADEVVTPALIFDVKARLKGQL